MKKFDVQVKKFFNELYNGNTNTAMQLMLEQQCSDEVESRRRLHYLAQAHMQIGQFSQARQLIDEAQSLYGANISLIIDRANCRYLEGDMIKWREEYNTLSKHLASHIELLSPNTKSKVHLCLAQFFESDGLISHANIYYLQALEDLEQTNNPRQFFKILSQYVRFQATYKIKKNLSQGYYQLLAYKVTSFDNNLNFYIDHALILAEVILLGPEHARTRYESSKAALTRADRNLLAADFTLELLAFQRLNKIDLQPLILSLALSMQLDELSPQFEKAVYKAAHGESDLKLMISNHHEIPKADYMRLANGLMDQLTETQKFELHKKILLLIDTTSFEDQKIWQEIFGLGQSASIEEVQYNEKRKTLSFANQEVSLARQKSYLEIIETVIAHTKIDTYKLIELLWRGEGSPEDVSRLRMRILRLNRSLQKDLGLVNFIKIENNLVSINYQIKKHSTQAS